jgi:hypothetical protein
MGYGLEATAKQPSQRQRVEGVLGWGRHFNRVKGRSGLKTMWRNGLIEGIAPDLT